MAIVEVDDNGKVELPHEFLDRLRPHAQLQVEVEGNAVTLRPLGVQAEEEIERLQQHARWLWTEASPEERAKAFREWLERPRPKSPVLPEEALHRESMYD